MLNIPVRLCFAVATIALLASCQSSSSSVSSTEHSVDETRVVDGKNGSWLYFCKVNDAVGSYECAASSNSSIMVDGREHEVSVNLNVMDSQPSLIALLATSDIEASKFSWTINAREVEFPEALVPCGSDACVAAGENLHVLMKDMMNGGALFLTYENGETVAISLDGFGASAGAIVDAIP